MPRPYTIEAIQCRIIPDETTILSIFVGAKNAQAMFDTVAGVATVIDPDVWLTNVEQAQSLIIIVMALIAPVYVEKGFVFINKDFADAVVGIDTQRYLHNDYS